MEIVRILLENGARHEWGDLSGTFARDTYIRDDEIGVLLKKHGFSLNYNYETKEYEPETIRKEIQPAQRGKALSSLIKKKRTQTTATDEPQPGPSRAVPLTPAPNINFAYHQQLLMNLNQVHQDLKDNA